MDLSLFRARIYIYTCIYIVWFSALMCAICARFVRKKPTPKNGLNIIVVDDGSDDSIRHRY